MFESVFKDGSKLDPSPNDNTSNFLIEDLLGKRVTRRRTLEKYVGIGSASAEASGNLEFPSVTFIIDRIVSKTALSITLELASPFDLEGMKVGTVAAGRIGLDALRKLKAFDVELHYFDRHRLSAEVEAELNLVHHESVESLVSVCDVVTINCPLHPETENLFDAELISKMKKGAYIVNTARGKICDRQAIVDALESGQLSGYAGDVWFPQPAPNDHVWRSMPHHGMTPHTSGTSLSAQARYAAGVREILEKLFDGEEQRSEYTIVKGGALAGTGKHSYTEGSATSGSEEAAEYKT